MNFIFMIKFDECLKGDRKVFLIKKKLTDKKFVLKYSGLNWLVLKNFVLDWFAFKSILYKKRLS